MSLAEFIIFLVASVCLLNTLFAPSIGFKENDRNRETKRFFILLLFNFLLVLIITLILIQSKTLMTIKI